MKETLVARATASIFRFNAAVVSEYPVSVIVVFTLITLICSIKIPLTQVEDDFNFGYTPEDARALIEFKKYKEFSSGNPLMMFVLMTAADGGSMARLGHLNETIEILEDIGANVKVKNQSFFDICTSFCNINEPVVQFRNGMLLRSLSQGAANESVFDDLSLRYPIMTTFGHELDLTPNFHGVVTYEEGEQPMDAITNIKYLKLVTFIIRASRPVSWTEEDADAWDEAIRNRLNEQHSGSLIVPHTYSFPLLQSEITKTSTVAFPYITGGFISVILFSVVTVAVAAWYLDQYSVWKLVYAIVACITPLMATGTCLGLLFWCGLRFGSILLISPFLLLAVGVDDAYIMINAWERVCAQRRKNPVPNDTLRDRITEVLVDAGPSITVTSLTNMLAFGVSALTSTPEIRLFCIANVLSMFLDLVFTVTLYLAVLVIGAKYEMQSENLRDKHKPGKLSSLLNGYCKYLSNGLTSACILLVMCAYWGAGIYGIMNVTPGVHPSKLLMSDSPLQEVMRLRDQYVSQSFIFVTVIVGDAGNLTDPERRKRIYSMVEQFEALPECNGASFTKFWMRDYEKFISHSDGDVETDQETDENVPNELEAYSSASMADFLQWPEYKFWGAFMNLDNRTDRVSKFFFVVAYHGTQLYKYKEKLRMLKEWRAIVDDYEDLSASLFEDDAQFTDQIETLIPQTLQNSMYSFVCVVLVCTLFMQNVATVFAASISIISIFIGVAGFMTLWGVELDPISMTTIILSIGMSVDYPAHIAYHYYHTLVQEPSSSKHSVMAKALSIIAFPLLQCCVSNIIIVVWLLPARTYVTQVSNSN
ncbi:unnamed protein product [Toxocara canis]|uniref:SSD domain-containing protein n=1 Tax=Toxocara canis TaxID=6265 RepID=A0A183UBI0_TOXCA|nr:unnamed protein product [Toxocara canis]